MWSMGAFIASTSLEKLEICNARAARLITGCPSSSENANTLVEARLPTIAMFIKEEAVLETTRVSSGELNCTAYTRAVVEETQNTGKTCCGTAEALPPTADHQHK